MAVGRLRLNQKSVSHTLGSSLIYTTCTLNASGVPILTGTVGGYISTNPRIAFKSGATVPLLGVISYGTPTSTVSLSKVRTIGARTLFYVVVGMTYQGNPTKFFAGVDAAYWEVQQNQGTLTNPNWVTIPYRNRAVRVAPTITASRTELLSGRSITYPPTPTTPPPTPPVTPPPTEDEEDEEEEEEEETPVTPTPTGINAIIQSFLTQVLTGIRTAVTTALGQITVSIPASFGTTVTALKNVVTALGTTLTTWATDAASTVSTAVTTANTSLSNAVRTGVTAVGNAISNAINTLKTALTTALTTMSTAITSAIAAIGRLVQQAITGIQTGLVNAYNRITGLITTSLGRVRNAISTASTNLVSTLNSRFRDISGVLSGLRMAIQSRINALVDTVRRQISALTLKVGELAIDFLGDIYRSGDSLWEWLVSLTGDTGQMIIRAVERILGPLSEDTLRLIRDGVPRSQHDLSYGSPPPPGLE